MLSFLLPQAQLTSSAPNARCGIINPGRFVPITASCDCLVGIVDPPGAHDVKRMLSRVLGTGLQVLKKKAAQRARMTRDD